MNASATPINVNRTHGASVVMTRFLAREVIGPPIAGAASPAAR